MSLPRQTWIPKPVDEPTDSASFASQAQPSIRQLSLRMPLTSSSLSNCLSRDEQKRKKMAHLQTKLTSFINSLAVANLDTTPTLYRTDSAASFASDSTCDETELQPWKEGHKRRSSEQDEVRRKREELAEKNRRASDAAWREFWP
jgi:hypothetical protein